MSQDIRHSMVGARLSDKVGRGVFANAAIVLQTEGMFAVDFLITAVHPRQVVARVFLAAAQFAKFVEALSGSLRMYEKTFGRVASRRRRAASRSCPARNPDAPEGNAPSNDAAGSVEPAERDLEDVYGQLKVSDETLEGAMANYVMIRHTEHEFCLDFVANIYPRSTLTSRVFMAAGRVPALLETLAGAWEKFPQEDDTGGQAL